MLQVDQKHTAIARAVLYFGPVFKIIYMLSQSLDGFFVVSTMFVQIFIHFIREIRIVALLKTVKLSL